MAGLVEVFGWGYAAAIGFSVLVMFLQRAGRG